MRRPKARRFSDMNDFDETLPAPFEWDVKRLAASLAVAGQVAKMPERECRRLASGATLGYREHLADLAKLSALDAWSTRIDLKGAIADVDSAKIRRNLKKRLAAILEGGEEHFGLVERKTGAGASRKNCRWCAI